MLLKATVAVERAIGLGGDAEFDPVAIGILDKGLLGAIGTDAAWQPRGCLSVKMPFPGVQIFGEQRKVSAAMR